MRSYLPIALAVVVLVLVSCAKAIPGTPRAEGEIDAGTVAGLAVTNDDTVPSGPKQNAPRVDLTAENADNGDMDQLALGALADLYEYWGARMPADFEGQKFTPLARLVSYDSKGKALRLCQTSTSGLVNAFYCSLDDSIAWDRGVLLPELSKQFGPMSVVTVLAHETGHAVQFKLGGKSGITQATKTIVKEQQADCYAGSFFRWIADGNSKRFQISTGEGINKVLATMFFIRDPAGTDANKQGAHGLAWDRVFAFQTGFSNGPKRCARMDQKEIDDRISEQKFDEDDYRRGNLPVNEEYVRKIKISLDEAFTTSGTQLPQLKGNGSKCPSGKATEPVAYCPEDNTVAYDLAKLTSLGTPPKRGQEPGADGVGIGDFAAFAEIASRYTMAIQKSVGLSLDDEKAALRTACLTGAWAHVAEKPAASGENKLRLSPGDLDEAVAEMLMGKSLIAADINGNPVKAGFARVEAFRLGYVNAKECTARFA
ncbi:neutral zinc metallopeptidase [Kibdelosporangium aridum]|uniref:Predicted metalloprotease n=1 Tax=Kibdelosporangium aridum TaxID=2030 RepID=A0A1W2FF79_KIBAR|nr:neutral zinc metallopeptidase [Kibdelosporangium aridum]SMD20322.1 Predicted metalloprotease [Kibdelosporangium aridum]